MRRACSALSRARFSRICAGESAERSIETGYDGYAIGGLAVGEGFEVMCEVLDFTTPHLPTERPRYLMGVGKPIDLVESVARGVDMFDCVLPTRSGRHGQAWSDYGPINIKRAEFIEDEHPAERRTINCPASRDYSRAYLNHLFRCGRIPLSHAAKSWHNIAYFEDLTRRMREAISAGEFESFRK